MIDIVRDYSAIGLGAAQATCNRVVRVGRDGAGQVLDWTSATVAQAQDDPFRAATNGPSALASLLHAELHRAVGRVGYVSGEEVRALRLQVQKMERRIAELRGDL